MFQKCLIAISLLQLCSMAISENSFSRRSNQHHNHVPRIANFLGARVGVDSSYKLVRILGHGATVVGDNPNSCIIWNLTYKHAELSVDGEEEAGGPGAYYIMDTLYISNEKSDMEQDKKALHEAHPTHISNARLRYLGNISLNMKYSAVIKCLKMDEEYKELIKKMFMDKMY